MKLGFKQKLALWMQKILANKVLWPFYKHIAEVNAILYQIKASEKKDGEERNFRRKYSFLVGKHIKNGPFKGMVYPFTSALHSTFFPKVLGCYEFELHDILSKLHGKTFHSILDIGSAEGYYAVGFAINFNSQVLLAYDLNPEARKKTLEMAKANGIVASSKFQVLEKCTQESLLKLDPSQQHLIFSDCEGFEKELFSREIAEYLEKSFFVIESHDFIVPGVMDFLKENFSESHEIEVISTVSDVFKYRYIQDEEINELPLTDQFKLLAERRPTAMEWLVASPKT